MQAFIGVLATVELATVSHRAFGSALNEAAIVAVESAAYAAADFATPDGIIPSCSDFPERDSDH
jgi:hypothetical protein